VLPRPIKFTGGSGPSPRLGAPSIVLYDQLSVLRFLCKSSHISSLGSQNLLYYTGNGSFGSSQESYSNTTEATHRSLVLYHQLQFLLMNKPRNISYLVLTEAVASQHCLSCRSTSEHRISHQWEQQRVNSLRLESGKGRSDTAIEVGQFEDWPHCCQLIDSWLNLCS
jgi:hypothetical protein